MEGHDVADIRVPPGDLDPVEWPVACQMGGEPYRVRQRVNGENTRTFGGQTLPLKAQVEGVLFARVFISRADAEKQGQRTFSHQFLQDELNNRLADGLQRPLLRCSRFRQRRKGDVDITYNIKGWGQFF